MILLKKRLSHTFAIFALSVWVSQAAAQKKKSAVVAESSYKTAIGLKGIFNFDDAIPALTGKFFFGGKSALETMFAFDWYRGYGTSSNSYNLYLLYEYHGTFSQKLPELKWYAGGGAMGGLLTSSGYGASSSTFRIGGSAIGGAEYQFKKIPLAVSIDWMPTYIYVPDNSTGAFNADVVGIGAKYILN